MICRRCANVHSAAELLSRSVEARQGSGDRQKDLRGPDAVILVQCQQSDRRARDGTSSVTFGRSRRRPGPLRYWRLRCAWKYAECQTRAVRIARSARLEPIAAVLCREVVLAK
jgi:hypothetical protein